MYTAENFSSEPEKNSHSYTTVNIKIPVVDFIKNILRETKWNLRKNTKVNWELKNPVVEDES